MAATEPEPSLSDILRLLSSINQRLNVVESTRTSPTTTLTTTGPTDLPPPVTDTTTTRASDPTNLQQNGEERAICPHPKHRKHEDVAWTSLSLEDDATRLQTLLPSKGS